MIGRAAIKTFLAPYMGWVIVALVSLALVGVGLIAKKAYTMGAEHQQAEDAKTIAEHIDARNKAAEALRAAGSALRAINTEAARRAAEVAAANARVDGAKAVAATAQAELRRRTSAFDRALRDARQNPGCAALLDMDVGAKLRACGVHTENDP